MVNKSGSSGGSASIPKKMLASGLYVIATPIGNLSDITIRALETLKSIDILFCEDTRQTAKLLSHYGINCPLYMCHKHNEQQTSATIINHINNGLAVGLVSDAGTPLIADPGAILAADILQSGGNIYPIPGVSSVHTALMASGIKDPIPYNFIGFLPQKQKAKKTCLAEAFQNNNSVVICFDRLSRLQSTAIAISELCSSRPIILARELTKRFEKFYRYNNSDELLQALQKDEIAMKGEIVLIIGSNIAPADADISEEEIDREILSSLKTMPIKPAAEILSKKYNLKKKQIYHRALELSKDLG